MKRYLLLALFFLPVFAQAQVTVSLSPVAKQQFFSSAGTPLAAGCVYTYAGGTTTFLASYTDSTGTTQNADPIQLDAGGFANIWLTGSAYKFAVWSNPSGGACPGVPGGSMAQQYVIDNITTTVSSGGSTASQLTSSGANPATSGIARLTKSDTICFRNAGNSANICASLDGSNNLTWGGGSLALTEITAPSGVGGEDLLWADSTAHRLKQSGNGGSAAQLVNAGADINTSDQVTVTHLASALPVAQGGTGVTTSTGSGNTVLSTSPALTTPTIGGTTITNVPQMTFGATAVGFTLVGTLIGNPIATFPVNSPITVKDFTLAWGLTFGGCATTDQWVLQDNGSTISTISMVNNTNSYTNTLSTNVAAGHTLTIVQTRNPSGGCTGSEENGGFTVVYVMQ